MIKLLMTIVLLSGIVFTVPSHAVDTLSIGDTPYKTIVYRFIDGETLVVHAKDVESVETIGHTVLFVMVKGQTFTVNLDLVKSTLGTNVGTNE